MIRLAKSSTAIGPDGMSTLHLKNLAQGAINYLTNIFNLSILSGQIPEIWHKAIIIPIPKPGKNWRPISLLCPAAKILEKLLQPKILTHIPFHPAQHGHRSKNLTCTALSTITADIAAVFSRKKLAHRTVPIALDLMAAFNNVDHQQLLDCVFNTNLPATIRHWLHNYMLSRRANVHFRQEESKSRKVKTGVVQGGVLSPALFNYYLADFPTPPPNIKLIKYADDITIYTSWPVVADSINGLNIYLSQVLNYIKKTDSVNGHIYSNTFHARYSRAPLTSTSDVGRPSTAAQKETKGVRSDARHPSHFHTALQQYRSKSAQHNNVLRALAGSTWGCDIETLLTTYQSIGRSILSYCCPVWTPSHKDNNWSRLQWAQNSALRITTDCLKMADVDELHQEVRELPVRQHSELISHQFAIACHLPPHPCHQLCHRPPDDRPERRRSLVGRFKPNIQQYLVEEPLSNTSYKSDISSIQINVVRTAIESSSSKLLNGRSPPIATA